MQALPKLAWVRATRRRMSVPFSSGSWSGLVRDPRRASGGGQVPPVHEYAHHEAREDRDGERRGDETCGDSQPSQPAGRERTAQAGDEPHRAEAEEQEIHPWDVARDRPSFEHERIAQERNRTQKQP